MYKINKPVFSLVLACLLGLLFATPALAFPPLPSSFYGQVKVNGQNVPDGTVVRALIGGTAYAETRAQLYQGSSVFSLDVPGDQADTQASEGGKEGDTVQFEVGGVLAGQAGVWHSGTNVELNLSVQSSAPLATPPPTQTPVPTQTAIPTRAPLPTATTAGVNAAAAPTSTPVTPPSIAVTEPNLPQATDPAQAPTPATFLPALPAQPTQAALSAAPTLAAATAATSGSGGSGGGTASSSTTLLVGAVVIVFLGGAAWLVYRGRG